MGKKNFKIKLETLEQIYWFLSKRKVFNFDGKFDEVIEFDRNGLNGVEAFYNVDANGKKEIIPTRHPNIYTTLMKVKSSCNLNIKMYAEDRASGVLPKMLFDELCVELGLPEWFIKAVEQQKFKYYDKIDLPGWFIKVIKVEEESIKKMKK